MPRLEIRELRALPEFAEAVQLQQLIWGFDDLELLPQRLFIVASKIGGQLLGAFDGSKMVAFCLCIPGLKPGGKAYLHSQMMGVLPEYRDAGVGRLLKLKQREYALEAGVDLIEWTFDPLEVKNAFFNIERLGAIVRRYIPNQYGRTTSHLHGGLPTDRLVAEWWIRKERVKPDTPQVRIIVPVDIPDLDQRRQVQERVGREFERHFGAGLSATGFERNETAGVYLLSEWQSE